MFQEPREAAEAGRFIYKCFPTDTMDKELLRV